MSNGRNILVVKNGKVVPVWVRKPPAPRPLHVWFGHCAAKALQCRVWVYAVKLGGVWRLQSVDHPDPIRTVPTEDAAAMWLLHRAQARSFR